MVRTLTSAVTTEIAATEVSPFLVTELDFSSGYVRVWTGIGDLSWDSKTWTGIGDLGGISSVQETSEVRAAGLAFRLSGIPSAMISTSLAENYQGRAATLWLGFMDSAGAVIADPIKIFSGRMDVMEIDERGDDATITVRAESRLVDLERAREWRYTHEDQQTLYSGDLGLEYVAALQDKEIIWKAAS